MSAHLPAPIGAAIRMQLTVAVATVGLLVGMAPVSLNPISGTALASEPIAPAVAFQLPTAIVAGGLHTCAVLADGSVKCWGQNDHGQLGDGTTTDSSAPVTVSGVSNAIGLALGYSHSCALLADGSVECWGSNSNGQLGNGTTTDHGTPVAVSGITTAQSISAGGDDTCALLGGASSGQVQCWGSNSNGQLGDGTTTDHGTPVAVAGITDATAITSGDAHECAIVDLESEIRCWGSNSSGQLGNGSTTDSSSPITVDGFGTYLAVAAGAAHTCAVVLHTNIRCWGSNTNGQLGNGTFTDSLDPVNVISFGPSAPTAIEAGGNDTCVVLDVAWCWGSDQDGELAIGEGPRFDSSSPTNVGGGMLAEIRPGVVQADRSAVHSVGFGPLRASGGRAAGPTLEPRPATIRRASVDPSVTSPQTTAITVGGFHMCALLDDATVRCWGYDGSDELGAGSNGDRHSPVGVYGMTTAAAVSLGGYHSCALVTGAHVECWGNNDDGELGNGAKTDLVTPVTVVGISTATAVSTSNYDSCARLSNATVRCWGYGAYGELGGGKFSSSVTPVAVSGISTASSIAAGGLHTCARLSNGTVRCWGADFTGQLGNGKTADTNTPVTVGGITTATAVSSGFEFSCALLSNKTVRCWGYNLNGQLGNGSTSASAVPVTVTGISTAVAISTGNSTACALLAGGSVKCWGYNGDGELGNGTTTDSPTPVAVSGITTAAAISVGGFHACALLVGGSLSCWGFNGAGELGNGTTTDSHTPVMVSGISSAKSVSAGDFHTCAVVTGEAINCWGDNEYGDLGYGALGYGPSPVFVRGLAPAAVQGATYVTLNPTRLLDSRVGNGLTGPFGSGTARTFQVTGRGGVPSNAVAITGNLTVTGQTSRGYVALGPVASDTPTSSTLNFPLADTRANGVTVALGAGGTLSATFIGSPGATTNLLLDVTGYFVPDSSGATYVTLNPTRLLDSRFGNGVLSPFVSGTAQTFRVTGFSTGIPGQAIAVTGNFTVTNQTSAGYGALGPIAANMPLTSTLNFPLGDVRANGVTSPLDNRGRLSAVFAGSAGAQTAFVFDVTGYFVP